MLGVEPDLENRGLLVDPVLPETLGALRLEGVVAFGDRHEVG
jgi:hypothetical protein